MSLSVSGMLYVVMYSLVSGSSFAVFGTCSTKFCDNFILQVEAWE